MASEVEIARGKRAPCTGFMALAGYFVLLTSMLTVHLLEAVQLAPRFTLVDYPEE